jgi:hypothetical protein
VPQKHSHDRRIQIAFISPKIRYSEIKYFEIDFPEIGPIRQDYQKRRPNGHPAAVIPTTTAVARIGFSLSKCTAKHRLKGIAMNKLTRALTMGGFGLLAALATGAGPAQAATTGSVPESKSSAHHVEWRSGEQIVGYYRTLRGCELAGQFGERAGNWDDHNCSIIRLGFRRGAWALQVASYDDWDRGGFGVPFRAVHGFPSRFRPVWPGVFRPGHPGPVFGHPGPVFGHPGPVFGHPGPVVGHPGPVFGHPGPVAGHPGPVFGHPGPVAGHPGPVFGHPGPVAGHPGPVFGQPRSAVTTGAPAAGNGH